jgi:hypothetical protein
MTIRIMTTLLPSVLSLLALTIAVQYPIDRRLNRQILAMIARRRKAIRDHLPMPQEVDPVTGADLPQVTGGLTTLSSEFCWYLDHFSESELHALLARGQPALLAAIWWHIYSSILIGVMGIAMVWFGGQGLKVLGVMSRTCRWCQLSFCANAFAPCSERVCGTDHFPLLAPPRRLHVRRREDPHLPQGQGRVLPRHDRQRQQPRPARIVHVCRARPARQLRRRPRHLCVDEEELPNLAEACSRYFWSSCRAHDDAVDELAAAISIR